jgi:hypothetical protein
MVRMQGELSLEDTDDGRNHGAGDAEPAAWRLDERTRAVGRLGIAAARRTLRQTARGVAA